MKIAYFDAHTHVQFAAYDEDRDEVIGRALKSGVGMINVGTERNTSRAAVELAQKYKNIYATVGLHPTHTSESYHDPKELGSPPLTNSRESVSGGEKFDYEFYKKLAGDNRVVAIGECGFDLFRTGSGMRQEAVEKQKQAFIKQIELAHEVKKPLMIHCRSAFKELIDTLVASRNLLLTDPGIIHFFSGTESDARILLEMGFYFTFGGVITFARDYDEIVKIIPLDRILSETDAPYVTPAPHRGKRNEPAYVIEVVKKLAELKNISVEKLAEHILKNVGEVFGITFPNP